METKQERFFSGLKHDVEIFKKGQHEKFHINAYVKDKADLKNLLSETLLEFCKENKISILTKYVSKVEFFISRRKNFFNEWVYMKQHPFNFEIEKILMFK